MREGIERHVREGKFPGGAPPYGYRRDDQNYLVVHETKARVVRMIFDWTVGGNTLNQVCDRLNGMGVPNPRGGTWIPATVVYMLHNEIYAGRWTFGRRGSKMPEITIDVPQIVDRAVWEKAQAALRKNRTRTGHPKHKYLLRGLIRCECGANYCGIAPRREGGLTNYRCLAQSDYRRKSRPEPCRSLTLRAAELEGAVWADIEAFVRQPHLVAEELSGRRDPVGAELTVRLAEVDKAIKERQTEIDRHLTLYGRGTIPVEQLDARVSEVQSHLDALEVYRASLAEEQRRLDLWEREMCGVVEALTALQERLDAGAIFEDQRALIEMLVKEIRIETATDGAEERYPVAHVTYRFERPDVSEAAIPIELEPLFTGVDMAGSCMTPLPVL